ncbi:hypothetical protein, partial [Arthrobacter sp. Hiyo1]|uniref:hypothetical protein n=1 Tax=Arthrobacter sp. Hiyo1 TaxID=1588020 RepID=UPI000A577F2E
MKGVNEAGADNHSPEQQENPVLRPRKPRPGTPARPEPKGVVGFLPLVLLAAVIAALAVPMGL